MNRSVIVSALCMTLLAFGCQETKEDLKNPISEKEIYKTIGEEIPFETGMEWISIFREKNGIQGRTYSGSSFEVPSAGITALLESIHDLTGVAFHYGLDHNGELHIVVIPVDGSLALWPADSGRVLYDANSGAEIDKDTALLWTANYKSAHPGEIWFHFFGKNVFDEIRALPYFESLSIEPAISSLDLRPQLLLIVWNDEAVSSGRSQSSPAVVYDASNACPPCAAR